ncbi:MAG: aspartate/glutamate racemase family protein [Deltaproteobacteria bacterium]|nr:aspartate/glutamate racemase family protein [Deltaproteobacteria bacterium]MBW2359687.1 aspartate/glutamate racemase family protein [Deltaproteobacteria bacterium]
MAEGGEPAIGILLLDYGGPIIRGSTGDVTTPRKLGDIGNAASYRYPVFFHTVKGLTFDRVLAGGAECERLVVEAAKELETCGVRGISSDCGFLISFQQAVSQALRIPVLLSSMLQLPMVAAASGSRRPVALITATDAAFGRSMLELAGVPADTPIIVRGLQREPHFKEAILEGSADTLDWDVIGQEVVKVVQETIEEQPETGAIVFECSLLPPYSGLVRETTGLPVFDFITLIDFLYAGTQ